MNIEKQINNNIGNVSNHNISTREYLANDKEYRLTEKKITNLSVNGDDYRSMGDPILRDIISSASKAGRDSLISDLKQEMKDYLYNIRALDIIDSYEAFLDRIYSKCPVEVRESITDILKLNRGKRELK